MTSANIRRFSLLAAMFAGANAAAAQGAPDARSRPATHTASPAGASGTLRGVSASARDTFAMLSTVRLRGTPLVNAQPSGIQVTRSTPDAASLWPQRVEPGADDVQQRVIAGTAQPDPDMVRAAATAPVGDAPQQAIITTAEPHPGTIGTTATALVQLPAPSKAAATWWAPAASALVPGTGQALLRQQRSVAYLIAEVFVVLQASRARSDYENARQRYRDIAADVARLQFGADRPVGPWEYYETLADASLTSSGNYDLAVGGKFTPETDEATYNGRQWLLARELYWESPMRTPVETSVEYQKAVMFYQSRAVQGTYRWSWRDNQNAKELYVQTINEANRSKQRQSSVVGLIAANHLLSMVDSYITVRLRRYGGAGLVGASIRSELRPTGYPGANSIATAMSVSLPFPGRTTRP